MKSDLYVTRPDLKVAQKQFPPGVAAHFDELPLELPDRDPQDLRGLFAVPPGVIEHVQDVGLVILLQAAEIAGVKRRCGDLLAQVPRHDGGCVGQQHGIFDDLGQLPDVSRVIASQEDIHRLRADPVDLLGVLLDGQLDGVQVGSSAVIMPFTGDIAEMGLYGRILTADEIDGIKTYLRNKYAL